MGLISDYYAATNKIPTSAPRVGIDRAVYAELEGQRQLVDPATTGFTAVNEVQVIGEATGANDGTYTITITLANGTTYTTAALAHDANAAAIETALDSASPSSVANGAISVSGGPLDSDDVTLTFDGGIAAGSNPALTTVNSASLVGGVAGAVTVSVTGQPARSALGILYALGVFVGTPPAQGAVPSFTVGDRTLGKFPSPDTIRDLAKDAAIQDSNDALYGYIMDALGVAR